MRDTRRAAILLGGHWGLIFVASLNDDQRPMNADVVKAYRCGAGISQLSIMDGPSPQASSGHLPHDKHFTLKKAGLYMER